jgi:DNA-directed RNA polymerase specialized sigma24 family protein
MAQNGDWKSLDSLVRRHSPWIYNIALRVLCHPDDAQDASQEILVKVLTRLSTFEGRSSFRTWLYRIAVNHLLTMKQLRQERWTGLLLCLDREQRLIYILGDIFGVSDRLGAELLELSRDNFRQKLSRARRASELRAGPGGCWRARSGTRTRRPRARRHCGAGGDVRYCRFHSVAW